MKTKRAAASSRRERLVVKSDADIRRHVKSPKLERDSKRLEAHLRKHGGEPSREELKKCHRFPVRSSPACIGP